MEKTICELFAGVGGFRLGFERLDSGWETVWFSQWEPDKKKQWAHDCYVTHFGDSPDIHGEYHTGEDISIIDKHTIPDHTLLVGGFPCQDYSIARNLNSSKGQGIEGKKGVLWWQIRDTIHIKKPAFCLFENVDHLLKTPSKQKGRDFGIILACLADEGYSVEWRVVNSADYGSAQRRRRTFIFAYRNTTSYGTHKKDVPADTILHTGFMAQAFPIREMDTIKNTILPDDITDISDTFQFNFQSAGYMTGHHVYTVSIIPNTEEPVTLGDILIHCQDESYYISGDSLQRWCYYKSAKKISRTAADGHSYIFSEGAIPFPDPWDRPSRTLLTSGERMGRTAHIVADPGTGRLRTLTPEETERLQGFPDGWTGCTLHNGKTMTNRMRYFCMGNSLVVPMVTRMGRVLDRIIEEEP